MWGACSEELAVPYEPWIAVCSQLVEHAPTELLRDTSSATEESSPGSHATFAGASRAARTASSDPETERYLLFSAVAGLLGEVAETVPLSVVLDDLHWADAQSLALLKHLLRTIEQGALQMIGGLPGFGSRQGPPAHRGAGGPAPMEGVERIALHGLGGDEVAEIMTAVAGHELDEDGLELGGRDRGGDRRQSVLRWGDAPRSDGVGGARLRRGGGSLERGSLSRIALPGVCAR